MYLTFVYQFNLNLDEMKKHVSFGQSNVFYLQYENNITIYS